MNTVAAAVRGALRTKSEGDTGEVQVKEIQTHLKRITDEIKTFAEKADGEVKRLGELSAETKSHVDQLLATKAEVVARLDVLEQKYVRGKGAANEDEFETAGQMVVKSEAFAQFVKNQTRGTLAVPMTLANFRKAAMLSTDVSQAVPGVVGIDMQPGILPFLRRRLFIRDLIAPGRTTAPAVAYVRQTGFTNNADVVSEGTAKPESLIAFDTKIVQVATIAHIFKAAKQLLDDFTALQSTIDAELRYGVKFAEEREILFGDGTGIHLFGIIPQATAYSPAFIPAHHQRIDVLRLAMLQSELALLPADGIVLHPTDWAHIELTKTTDGAYIFANPRNLASPSLWGLPVVPTQAMTAGDFLTGPFSTGAQLYDREDVNVVIATQNEDDFIRNLITIRAEERVALAVKRPEGFITGEFPEDSE